MAKTRRPQGNPGSDLDYYEYKRQHELRRVREQRVQQASQFEPAAAKAQQKIEPANERARQAAAADAEEIEEEKPRRGGLFGGVKSLVKNVSHRVPEEEYEEEFDEEEAIPAPKPTAPPKRAAEPAVMAPAVAADEGAGEEVDFEDLPVLDIGDEAFEPQAQRPARPARDGDFEGDEEAFDDSFDDDAPQIDNPFAGVTDKVKLIFGKAKALGGTLAAKAPKKTKAPKQSARRGADEEDEEEDEAFQLHPDSSGDDLSVLYAADDAGATSRRARKGRKAQGGEAPSPYARPVDGEEEEERPSRRSARRVSPVVDDEDDDYDDIKPSGGLKLFGFMRGRAKGDGGDDGIDLDEPDFGRPQSGEDADMDDGRNDRIELTRTLADEAEAGKTLSRRERRALAGQRERYQRIEDEDEGDQIADVADEPEPAPPRAAPSAPPARDGGVPIDEPTQQFTPLRARMLKARPAPSEEADYDDEDYDEDEDDMPARQVRAEKKAQRAEKKAEKRAQKARKRVYRDEDLDDEEYGDYEDEYDDEYDDYEYDEDDYDDYEAEDEYEREYHVSIGRRILGVLKGLIAVALFLAISVVALRVLENSRVISLGGLRDTVGKVMPGPLEWLFPAPEPLSTEMPNLTPLPSLEPTPAAEPTQAAQPEPTGAQAADLATPAPQDDLDGQGQPNGVEPTPDGGAAAPDAGGAGE